jgi:hypothetical protein
MTKKPLLLIAAFFFAASVGRAEFKNAAQGVEVLKKYDAAYFAESKDQVAERELDGKDDGVDAENEVDKLDEVYTDLQSAVTLLQKKSDGALLSEAVRVAAVTLDNDPSWFAGDLLLPLYKKDKKALLEAIKKLPADDAKNLEEAVTNSAREKKKGNG